MMWLRLLRPHQWIKNSFVFIGIFFAHAFANSLLFEKALFAFVAFCLMSSAVYIYNDIIDYPQDRLHATKKNRPLASEKITLKAAVMITMFLFWCAIGVAFFASNTVVSIITSYFLLNMAYTHFLKRIVIIDVFCISAGFMLRILAGTAGVGITPSAWLLFCGLTLTLFLGFAKRRAEVSWLAENPFLARAVLKEYGQVFLDKMISIMASCTIMGYALYTMSPETIQYHQTQNLIYTVPFVIYGIFRYLYLLHRKKGGEDTAMDLIKDKPFMIAVAGWLAMIIYMIF